MVEGKCSSPQTRVSKTRQKKRSTMDYDEDYDSIDLGKGGGKVIKVMLPKLIDKNDSLIRDQYGESTGRLQPWIVTKDSRQHLTPMKSTPKVNITFSGKSCN